MIKWLFPLVLLFSSCGEPIASDGTVVSSSELRTIVTDRNGHCFWARPGGDYAFWGSVKPTVCPPGYK